MIVRGKDDGGREGGEGGEGGKGGVREGGAEQESVGHSDDLPFDPWRDV